MAAFIVIGVIAWALMEQGKHLWRAARGEESRPAEHGFRGYLNDRWQALADRHHRNAESGLLTSGDKRARKRHLAREKALAFAGFRTEEDIARAAYHHRRRLGLINQGIEPDSVPDDPGAPALKRARRMMPDRDAHGKYKAPKEKESKKDLDTTDVIGLTDLDEWKPSDWYEAYGPTTDDVPKHVEEQILDGTYAPGPWTPFTEPTKENTNMTAAGEINNPADVKAFADAMAASLDTITSTIDTLDGIATGLAPRATDHAANATAAEHAAGGMDGLGMTDAATAARALIEQQKQIEASLLAVVEAIQNHTALITDQTESARANVAAIGRAYTAQLSVADARAGVGRGNLAEDKFLDGDV